MRGGKASFLCRRLISRRRIDPDAGRHPPAAHNWQEMDHGQAHGHSGASGHQCYRIMSLVISYFARMAPFSPANIPNI